MKTQPSKRFVLTIFQYTGLELCLRAAEILFTKRYQKKQSFIFMDSFPENKIGNNLYFEIDEANHTIEFSCPWKSGKIAELRLLEEAQIKNDKHKQN